MTTDRWSDGAAGPRGRGRPRDPGVDAAILKAALELFVEGGVEAASMQRIAARAGVGKLTVYRRWSSKEELLAQAIESARENLPEVTAEDVEHVPVAELVERAIPATADALAEPGFRAFAAQTLGTSVTHPALMAAYWEHYVLPRRRAIRVMLERAIRDGVLSTDTDVEALIDMMVGAMIYRVLHPPVPDSAELRDYLRSVYRLAGLLP
ncbi:TetR/AcrR family transcriptional regulator [Actinorugispora endophytica]|uniref:TetR family transcriptional regulator n=1 Tax=Actinorugispora endophytica TaxID=1605990 RepID=A0A4R6UC36_9ACTN|nr:TetR/AcrR family transcriptional regulator [Actinorugispora endophytica]TDQ44250.1 TetR family transcriptional regulator [Actinorugispora endophytica]